MAQQTDTTVKLPSYIEGPVKTSLGNIEDWLNSDANYVYGSKPGESLFTDLTGMQKDALGNVDWLANQDLGNLFGLDQAGDWIKQFGDYSSGSIMDESGPLGSIDSYMNPYLQQVLNPVIANMQDQMKMSLNETGFAAQGEGAFGDARHGLSEATIARDTSRDIGEMTSRAYADAFSNAMGYRTADRSQMNEENSNKLSAAAAQSGLGNQLFSLFTDVNDQLFNAGEIERDVAEERRQKVQDFQTAINEKRYTDALKLLGAATGAPYQTSSTSKQSSDDGLWGLLGAGIGALF